MYADLAISFFFRSHASRGLHAADLPLNAKKEAVHFACNTASTEAAMRSREEKNEADRTIAAVLVRKIGEQRPQIFLHMTPELLH